MSYEAYPAIRGRVQAAIEDAPRRHRGASSVLMTARVFLLLYGLVALFFIPASAYAHKVNMFAYVEGDKVMMEGYFADGNKPVNCEVIVTDPGKQVLVKGLTDHEGKFSFAVPEITDLRIVLNAGMGHRAEFVISRSELAGVSPAGATADASATPEGAEATEQEKTAESQESPATSPQVSEAAIRKAVAEANLPLVRAIEELKEGASFGNIVGGIGIIFGIVGIFFYLKARKMLGSVR